MHRRSRWLRFQAWVERHGWIGGPIIFLLAAAVFTWLLIDPTFADPDSFYHARLAQLMSEQGIVTQFPYLRYTYLYEHFTDHHLLYHLILVPFVKWLPMFTGIKVATVVLGATFFMVWFYLARSIGGWLPSLTAVLLLATRPFDFRLGLSKASALALILLFVGFWLIVKKKYPWLFLLGFLYAWAHGGFALLWVVSAITGAAIALSDNRTHLFQLLKKSAGQVHANRTFHLKKLLKAGWKEAGIPTVIAFFGTVAGTVFNPYVPNNLRFLWQQFVQIGVINYQEVITVGAEWYPYPWQFLIPDTAILGIALISVIILTIWFRKKTTGLSWATLLLTIFFFVLTLKSRRFIEYAVPWGWLCVTVTWGATEIRQYAERRWSKIKKFVLTSHWHAALSALFVMYFLVMIPAIAAKGFYDNKRQFSTSIPLDRWAGATAWMQEHTPEGSLVFHDDWDGFPLLFAHDPHNTYIIGLDPTFLYLYDENLYWKYVNVTTGKEEGRLSEIIGDDFHAQYVFVAVDHAKLQNQLRRDDDFVEVYKDDEASVFLLKKE